jgi:hypothetical protein
LVHELVLAEDAARSRSQDLQERQFPAGQIDRRAVDRHRPRTPIDGDAPADELIGGLAGTPPQERSGPGLQLSIIERLDQIVVRSEIERVDAVVDLRSCRQDEHGHLGLPLPETFQNREAVQSRQVYVQNQEIVSLEFEQLVSNAAVLLPIDPVADPLEARESQRRARRLSAVRLATGLHGKASPVSPPRRRPRSLRQVP